MRQLAAHTDSLDALSRLHRQALARLVPEFGDAGSGGVDPEQFVLFEAVVNMLERASADQPLIVVLDDVHWADNASLDLLRHLVTRAASMTVLVVATFRDSDLSRGDPLSRLIADMHREQSVSRIHLAGLSDIELMALMEAAAGHELEDDGVRLAHALRRETEGNPFFVAEMLRHLGESGEIYLDERNRYVLRTSIEQLGLPTSVRDVVARRVERLGDEALRVLTVAAVIGREFAVDVLAEVADVDEDPLLDLLEAAVGGAVLTEPADRPGRFRFAHGLIQHTLYRDLGATRRQRLHARVAQVLEERSDGGDGDVPELARHWLAATRPAEQERALHYTRRAGDLALDSLAPDDAARWFRRGLELLGRDGDVDHPARGALLVGLGRAQQMLGDDTYRATLLDAADLAERLGDRDLLIASALASTRGVTTGGSTEDPLLAVTQRALAAIGNDNTPERVRLLTALTEQTDARDWRTARDRAHAAVDAARTLGDPRLIVEAVTATFLARSQPDTLEDRQRDTAEAMQIADRLGDPMLQFHARHARRFALMELGDIEGADRAVGEMEQLLGGSQLPLMRYLLGVDVVGGRILAGDYAAAEAAANELLTVMTAAGYADALALYGGLLFTIRREQGRLAEIADLFIDAARANPGLAALRATVSLVYCELGDLDVTRATFAGDDDFLDSFPYDFTWMVTMTNLADVAVALGDRDAAARILQRLEPYASQNIAVAGLCSGAASRPIARLQALLGHDDLADATFGHALEYNRNLGAPFWIASTELDYAEALAARGSSATALVGELARSALDTARAFGFAGLEHRALEIVEHHGT